MGRSPEGGQVRLTKMEDMFKLVWQQLAMLVGVQFVQVHVNNLYAWPKDVEEASTKAKGKAKGVIKARAHAPGSRAASQTRLAISFPSF